MLTQFQRDQLEGITPEMRRAIDDAKRMEYTRATIMCQGGCRSNGRPTPVIAWGGVQEIEGGRTCHVCRTASVLSMLLTRGR